MTNALLIIIHDHLSLNSMLSPVKLVFRKLLLKLIVKTI